MHERLRLLDLFSGIGGFSLGLERSGAFRTVAFCEIEPFCQRILAKHWPGVPIFTDIKELAVDGTRQGDSGRHVRGRAVAWQDCGGVQSQSAIDVGRSSPTDEDARSVGRTSAQRQYVAASEATYGAAQIQEPRGQNNESADFRSSRTGSNVSNVWTERNRHRSHNSSVPWGPNDTGKLAATLSPLSPREVPQGQKGGLNGSLASVGPIDAICGGFP